MSLCELSNSLEALSLEAPTLSSAAHKRALGQFFTTNFAYILTGLRVPADTVRVVEPFCGEGHLLRFLADPAALAVERYDLDPKTPDTERRDSIMDPPDYAGAFVLTNPPYLARNKSADKAPFDKYGTNDLYKCFIAELTRRPCAGGIVVVPLNFWCSVRKADVALRAAFLARYAVARINVFEERVFEDTSYTVCAFQFALAPLERTIQSPSATPPEIVQLPLAPREADAPPLAIPVVVFPSMLEISAQLSAANSYLIGGDIYRLPVKGRYRVSRLTSKNVGDMGASRTTLRAKCIDDSLLKCIALEVVSVADADAYVDTTPGQTARTYALLAVEPPISAETQALVAARINALLSARRAEARSLFLSNFRESKDVARKRISFDLVYRIVEHVLDGIDAEAEAK